MDILAVELAQPLAGVTAAEVEVVAVRTATDEADLGDERTAATVRAAGHADGDRVVAKAGVLELLFELGDNFRQVAFGFGERQAAGRQGDAGDRRQPQRTALVTTGHAVLF